MFSPIALFVFNRPTHTKKVLDKLALNKEAKNSELFVFCDGLKRNASDALKIAVQETRSLIDAENRFKKITIYRHDENIGLAKSIIFGVTKVLSIYDKIIVLEDDIVPEKGFLKYMNDALNLYHYVDEIGCIHAWNYSFKKNYIKESTFLLRGADCWGWGTWKRSWDLFESDGNKLRLEIEKKHLIYSFNRNGTHQFYDMLKDQIDGKNDSWAIRWHASLFLANKYCIWPKYPIVKNIGLDGSGTHCGEKDLIQLVKNKIKINKFLILKESDDFYNSFKTGLIEKINIWQKTLYFFRY